MYSWKSDVYGESVDCGKSVQYGESGDCAYAGFSLKYSDSGECGESRYSREYGDYGVMVIQVVLIFWWMWQKLSVHIHQNHQNNQKQEN